MFEGDRKLDFRTIIHTLGLGQPRLDPADPYAYRLVTGSKLTCDKEEAEIAIAPIRINPGFAATAQASARGEFDRLLGRLSAGVRLEGCSTHISIAVPEAHGDEVAALYTRRFAPDLILLVDGSSSPGLAIRPRPGRLELCGEFLEGFLLRAAVAFAVGGVAACTQAVALGDRESLPPELDVRLLPVVDRYGWYVDARPLVDRIRGRAARWKRAEGRTVSAEGHLALAWAAARQALGTCAADEDLAIVSRMIAGDIPPAGETTRIPPAGAVLPMRGSGPALGDLLTPRHRARFELAPLMVTWDVNVFVIVAASSGRLAFATVPTDWMEPFLSAMDAGLLDEVVDRYLSAEPSGRQLERRSQALQAGLYDELPSRAALLAAERDATAIPRAVRSRRRSWRSRVGDLLPAAIQRAQRARDADVLLKGAQR